MNVLGVGAHFDDLELGCGGTLIRHRAAGDRVTMLIVTDSVYSDPRGRVVRGRKDAVKEGAAAAKTIGAKLICLEYKTLEVPFNEALTREIRRHIEDLNIDTVYSHWIHDLHRDHQNAGRCTLMAGRHVPRFLMYRSNWYDSGAAFKPSVYSDVSKYINKKTNAIKAHKSELKRVRDKWIPHVLRQNKNDGEKVGVSYAESFEAVRYLV